MKEVKDNIINIKDNDVLKIKLTETLHLISKKKYNSNPSESDMTSLMNLYELSDELTKLK